MIEAFYLDGLLYDAMHADMAHDVDFYVRQAMAAKGPVLELACGTGRLTLPIARHGIDITGLDLQASMLAQAKAKADAEGLKVGWVQGDMRAYDLGRQFALIFIPFNSLLHLHAFEDLLAFFACAKRHLLPGGRLIIDIFNPSVAILASGKERARVRDFIDPRTGEAAWIDGTRNYDALTQVNRILWTYSTATRSDFLSHDLHLRCIFPQELQLLVTQSGLEVLDAFGDHVGGPLSSASPLQLLVLTLTEGKE